jgi:hypothetical protein
MKKLIAAYLFFFVCAVLVALVTFTKKGDTQTEPFNNYIAGLPVATNINTTDSFYILQAGISKNLPGSVFLNPNVQTLNCGVSLSVNCTIEMFNASGASNTLQLGTSGGLQMTNPAGSAYTLPITPGTAGQVMTSVGGGNTPMGWSNVTAQGYNIVSRFGSMDVWQRGAGGSASFSLAASTTTYTVDGCYLFTNANQASTVSQTAGIAVGSISSVSIERNSGQTGTGGYTFGCPLDVDEVALLRGNYVTLSGTMSTGANFSASSVAFVFVCGTGSPTKFVNGYTGSTTYIQAAGPTAASSPATRYQGTSTSVVATGSNQCEVDIFWTPSGTAGAADTIVMDDVQLEIVASAAGVATPYQHVTFEDQLAKAMRHFQKTFAYSTAPAQDVGIQTGEQFGVVSNTNSANNRMWGTFKVPMRVNPTMTTYNPQAANANVRDESSTVDCTITAGGASAGRAFQFLCTTGASSGVGNLFGLHYIADAGI